MMKTVKDDRVNSALTDLSSDLLCSKKKSDELFLFWMSRPETQEAITMMIAESVAENSPIEPETTFTLYSRRSSKPKSNFATKKKEKEERMSVFKHPVFTLDLPVSHTGEDSSKSPKSPREGIVTSTSRGNICSPRMKSQDMTKNAQKLSMQFSIPMFIASFLLAKFQGDMPLAISFLESQTELPPEEKLFFFLKDTQASMLTPHDMIPFVKALIDDSDQLSCLLPTGSFQLNAYVTMVIVNIFHRISKNLGEFKVSKDDFIKKGTFLTTLFEIHKNSVFWEQIDFLNLQKTAKTYDHYLLLTQNENLTKENLCLFDNNLNERVIANAYDYIDFPLSLEIESDFPKFAWFTMMLDRSSPLSKKFWFQCCDQDRDSFLSREDLEFLYKQQIFKMQSNLFEVVTFSQLALDFPVLAKSATSKLDINDVSQFGQFVLDMLIDYRTLVDHLKLGM